jgi:Ca2+:H+ antiporter
MPDYVETRTRVIASIALLATAASVILMVAGASSLAVFGATAVALAGLAAMVGEATDQIAQRLGPGATGVLQSALGNLPELFISIFALQAGLVAVVQAALVGSILANTLLVLGLAFIAGGLRNGPQRFGTSQTRMMAMLLVLAVGAMAIPALATAPGAPDAGHPTELSVVVSIVLLVVFAASIPVSVGAGSEPVRADREVEPSDASAGNGRLAAAPADPALGGAQRETPRARAGIAVRAPVERAWPMPLAIGALAASGVAAAFVSDWFVGALRPAMATLGMSEAFAGLVVVAIAGNAVENVVGIQAAVRDQADLAISLILNSALQVALALVPVLVLLSLFVGAVPLTLVVSPLLVGSLALGGILAALIVFDGESTWLEGLALVGLYAIIAAGVWWGPPIGG